MRGEIVKMAAEIKKKLAAGEKFPFKKVVMCNIGNPQALGQKPITFFRQVLALCEYPQVGWLICPSLGPHLSSAGPKGASSRVCGKGQLGGTDVVVAHELAV